MAIVSQTPSISEVKTALAETSNSVGGLCTSSKIKKWAKFKPIRNSKKGDVQLNDYINANYGIQFPIYSNVTSLIEGITTRPLPGEQGNEPIWRYLRPQGGASQPYRIGDFRGYKHNSVIPFGLFNVTKQASKTGGSPIITGMIGFIEGSDPNQLRLQDFNFGNRRFAMAYKKSGETTFKTVIGNVGKFSVDLNVNDANLTTGTYEAYLFMTNNVGGVTNILGFEGHPEPNILGETGLIFRVVTQTVSVSIYASYNQLNPNQIFIEVRANNETGASVTLLNSLLQVRSSTNECESIIEDGEVYRGIGTIVAPAGNNVVYSETITVNRDKFPIWKVCWRNSGVYPHNFFANIIQEM